MKTIYRLLIMVVAPALFASCVDLDYSEVTTIINRRYIVFILIL